MPRKTGTAACLILALAQTLGACATPTPEVIVVTATPPGADTLPAEMLGVEWQLYSVLESEPAAQSVVPEPQRYTIQFTAEGTAAIRADCNDVLGNYTIQGSNMTITLGPTTLAFCGEESGDHLDMAALGQVSSYSLTDRGMQLAVDDDAARLSYLEAKDVIDLPEEPGGVDITADVSLQIRTGPGVQFRISHRALQGDQGEVVGQSPDDLYWVVLFPEDHPHYDRGWVRKSETSISNPSNEEIPVITPPLLNPTVEVTPPESSEPQATVGQVAAARAEARRVLDALAPYVARGVPVIGLEPSCLFTLRDEFAALLPGPTTEALAARALLFEEFLAAEQAAGRLKLEFAPRDGQRALLHGHCHQKAFGAMAAVEATLRLVPGLEVETIQSSCCGMAGAFGYGAETYETSIAMGEAALLPKVRAADAETLVVAGGTSCRHQIRDGAGREAVHPARVLKDALR